MKPKNRGLSVSSDNLGNLFSLYKKKQQKTFKIIQNNNLVM